MPFGDIEAAKAAIGPQTGAILIEPIQGKGVIRAAPPRFLRGLRELCDKHGFLLMFDEVQTGIGRTGKLFAYELFGVAPDIMAIAKGLGGGFPLGAFLRRGAGHDPWHAWYDVWRPGNGTNKISCRAEPLDLCSRYPSRARRPSNFRSSSTSC